MLVIVLCFASFAACTSTTKKEPVSQSNGTNEKTADATLELTEPSKLFDAPLKISIMVFSSPNWPYQEDWYIRKAIEEKTNVQMQVEAIGGSSTDFTNKVNLSIAAGEMFDMIYTGTVIPEQYGPQGAFVNVKDHMNELPNFKKWSEKNPLEILPYLVADGSMYMFPNYGIGETNRRGYIYRKDIFKKHNLSIPQNEEEFYNVLTELKKLYPDTYPFTFRSSLGQFEMMAQSWGTGWQYYFDSSKKEWRYGPIEDNFKTMAMYFHKLYKDGLIPPDWITLDTSGWQDIVATEKAFITIDYISRIDGFNNMVRGTNPDFTMAYMAPYKGGANGVNKMAASAENIAGYAISAQSKNVDKILKFMDWFYTDEAKDLVSWGEEGKTYQVVNGQKQFIDAKDLASVRNKYGLATNGFYLLYDFDGHLVTYTDELRSAIEEDRKYDLPAQPKVKFTDEEQEIIKTTGVNVSDHMQEQLSKFLLDQRPFSEWDNYVKELKDLGLDKIVELYQKAYDRLMK